MWTLLVLLLWLVGTGLTAGFIASLGAAGHREDVCRGFDRPGREGPEGDRGQGAAA